MQVDSAGHPGHQVGGSLRPLICTMVAALLMYYTERCEAGEARGVRIRMKQALTPSPSPPMHGHMLAYLPRLY